MSQEKNVLGLLVVLVACAGLFTGVGISAIPEQKVEKKVEPDKGADELALLRSENMKKWGGLGLLQPREVIERAKKVLALPLADQSREDLLKLADEANRAANLVGFIEKEYEQCRLDNYRYDFILKKLDPFHNAYVSLSNSLKDARNTAFFNLGLKEKAEKNNMIAFFYFYDAFRLSTFEDSKEGGKGMRYKAEGEMKELLGIGDLPSYTTWQ